MYALYMLKGETMYIGIACAQVLSYAVLNKNKFKTINSYHRVTDCIFLCI